MPVAPDPELLPSVLHDANHFHEWTRAGVLERLPEALAAAAPACAGRNEEPTAAQPGNQGVTTTESGGASGVDAGKRITGRERHMTVEVEGLPIVSMFTPPKYGIGMGCRRSLSTCWRSCRGLGSSLQTAAGRTRSCVGCWRSRPLRTWLRSSKGRRASRRSTFQTEGGWSSLAGWAVAAAWPGTPNGRSTAPPPGRNRQPAGCMMRWLARP